MFHHPCLAVIAILLCLVPAAAQLAPFEHPDGTTHWYQAVPVTGGVDWAQANAGAASLGGHLATITSAEENAFVFGLVNKPELWTQSGSSHLGPWIGGVQPAGSSEPAGGWSWAVTEAFSYANWAGSRPGNANGADRLHFGDGPTGPVATWADAPESAKMAGFVVEFAGAFAPRTAGLRRREPGSFDGYTLISPWNSLQTWLIDPRGRIVNEWTSKYYASMSCYLEPNGHLLRCGKIGNLVFTAGGGGGIVEEFDWQGNLVWQFAYSSNQYTLHHDVERLPNGNVLMLVWEMVTQAEAIAAGRDPAKLRDGMLWPCKIIEVQPEGKSGGKIVWQWRAFDHVIQDFDSTKANYGRVEKHPERIDLNYTSNGVADWLHSNSVAYNAKLDQIVVSMRSFDEIWVIDHSTSMAEAAGSTGGRSGNGGDLLYRWGNPLAYRAGTAKEQTLFKQHDAHWIADGLPGAGNILIFNNGVGRPGGNASSVDEIVTPVPDANGNYPRTGAAWGPTAPTWTFQTPVPTDFYSSFVSGCQRLPNGNTLVCAGALGHSVEVMPDGTIVWEYTCPDSNGNPVTQGSVATTNQVFRSPRYAPDHPGLRGRVLTPGEPMELYREGILVDGSTAPQFVQPGAVATFSLYAAGAAGKEYRAFTSLTPGLFQIDYRWVRLGFDAVLIASLHPQTPGIFQNYFGKVDAQGRATARVQIPSVHDMIGLSLYTGFAVHDPAARSGVERLSNTVFVKVIN